jgi:single-strand DNA-binding protein
MMNLNLVVLAGRLAAPPELRSFESGSRLYRYLVTIRSESPHRRVDVVPVTQWDPDANLVENPPEPGTRVWVAGSVQRRFWTQEAGRHSRLEVVASDVQIRDEEDAGLDSRP